MCVLGLAQQLDYKSAESAAKVKTCQQAYRECVSNGHIFKVVVYVCGPPIFWSATKEASVKL